MSRCSGARSIGLTAVLLAILLVFAKPAISEIDISSLDLSVYKMANAGTGPMLDQLNAATLIPREQPGHFGFSVDVSPQKGAFRLGIWMADLQIAANGGDSERTQTAAKNLLFGLNSLGAPDPLISSVVQLISALQHGVQTQAVARLARPMLAPHIRAFIESKGELTYYFLGEWSETLYLATAARDSDNGEPLPLAKQATGFAVELQSAQKMSASTEKALGTLAEIGRSTTLNPRQVQEARKALDILRADLS